MSIAQQIISAHTTVTFADQQRLIAELRELAFQIEGPNCYDRIYHFIDGSLVKKTRDGFFVGWKKIDESA